MFFVFRAVLCAFDFKVCKKCKYDQILSKNALWVLKTQHRILLLYTHIEYCKKNVLLILELFAKFKAKRGRNG